MWNFLKSLYWSCFCFWTNTFYFYSLLTTCEYSVLEPREVSQYIINASSRAQAPSSPAKSLSLVLKNSLLPGPGPRSRSQTVGGPVSETPTLRLAAEHTGAWARDWGVSNEWTIITERLRQKGDKLQRDENIVRRSLNQSWLLRMPGARR